MPLFVSVSPLAFFGQGLGLRGPVLKILRARSWDIEGQGFAFHGP